MGKQGKFIPDSFSIKHLDSLLRMFDDPLRAKETITYVGCKRSRECSAGVVKMLDADALEYLEEMINKNSSWYSTA